MVYFAIPAQNAPNAKFLTTAEISEKLISKGNIKNPLSLSRLGVLLSQQGFLSVRRGSPCKRGWIVYERDSEEINAERKMLAKWHNDGSVSIFLILVHAYTDEISKKSDTSDTSDTNF